jgi:AmmeMemoRadiSam system protein A
MSQPPPSSGKSSERISGKIPENVSGKTAPAISLVGSGEFSQDERTLLLRVAHHSILAALEPGEIKREVPRDPPTAHLSEPRGVFTSLYLRGELRGCVGYVLPKEPVYRAVAETAQAAAFEDTRFPPVTLLEARALRIELSLLSPPQPIPADAIEIGRHGLLISLSGHRGLLLPQVPLEHNWDRITFLEQTCRKAGLPLDAWKNGAKIEAFTAEVFGDHDRPAS